MHECVVKDRGGNIVVGPMAAETAKRYAAALNSDYQTDEYRSVRWEVDE